MTAIDLDIEPKKPINEVLKPGTDRVTREPSEHPDRIPAGSSTHPVTTAGRTARRERIGVD